MKKQTLFYCPSIHCHLVMHGTWHVPTAVPVATPVIITWAWDLSLDLARISPTFSIEFSYSGLRSEQDQQDFRTYKFSCGLVCCVLVSDLISTWLLFWLNQWKDRQFRSEMAESGSLEVVTPMRSTTVYRPMLCNQIGMKITMKFQFNLTGQWTSVIVP